MLQVCLWLVALLFLIPTVLSVDPQGPIDWLQVYKSREFPSPVNFREQMQRGLPSINIQDVGHHSLHPNEYDQVEAALSDAFQLALVTLRLIDNDQDFYPHYLAQDDRDMVKKVYEAAAGICGTGNVLLSNIHIQTTDFNPPICDEYTLAHVVR